MAIQIYSQKNNAWRDANNPLRGMNLARLMALLDAGERGQYADLQWFYHYMERSDPMVFSVMQRRRAVLLSCDWDIRKTSDVRRKTLNVAGIVRESGSPLNDKFDASLAFCLMVPSSPP